MPQDGTSELMLRIQGLPGGSVSVSMVVHTHTHTHTLNASAGSWGSGTQINMHVRVCPPVPRAFARQRGMWHAYTIEGGDIRTPQDWRALSWGVLCDVTWLMRQNSSRRVAMPHPEGALLHGGASTHLTLRPLPPVQASASRCGRPVIGAGRWTLSEWGGWDARVGQLIGMRDGACEPCAHGVWRIWSCVVHTRACSASTRRRTSMCST